MGTDFEKLQEGASGRTLPGNARCPGRSGPSLCEDCTDSLLEQLETWLTSSESQSENYRCCMETRERRGRHGRGSRRAEGPGWEERRFHRDYSKLQWRQLDLHEERRSAENRLRYTQTQLARLENTNAFGSGQRLQSAMTAPSSVTSGWAASPGPSMQEEIGATSGHMALLLQR